MASHSDTHRGVDSWGGFIMSSPCCLLSGCSSAVPFLQTRVRERHQLRLCITAALYTECVYPSKGTGPLDRRRDHPCLVLRPHRLDSAIAYAHIEA